MKLSKTKLKQLIKEEIENMQEADLSSIPGWENWKELGARQKRMRSGRAKAALGSKPEVDVDSHADVGFRPEVDEGAKENAVDILRQLAAFLEDGNPTAEDVLDVEWAVVNLSKQIFKNM